MSPHPDDDALREAFSAPVDSAGTCPEPEKLWQAGRGELSAEEAARVVEHTIDCAACAASLRLVPGLARDVGAALGGVASESVGGHRRWWWGIGAVAAVLVLAILVPIAMKDRGEGPAPLREAPVAEVRSSLERGAPLPRDDFVLRWEGTPTGSLCRVEVAARDLTVLHEAGNISGNEYRVPPEALVELPSGSSVLWRVEAVLPDGTRLRSSTFRVLLQ